MAILINKRCVVISKLKSSSNLVAVKIEYAVRSSFDPKTKTISCGDKPGSIPTEYAVGNLVNKNNHFIKLYPKNCGWTPTSNGNVHFYVNDFLEGSSDLSVWGKISFFQINYLNISLKCGIFTKPIIK